MVDLLAKLYSGNSGIYFCLFRTHMLLANYTHFLTTVVGGAHAHIKKKIVDLTTLEISTEIYKKIKISLIPPHVYITYRCVINVRRIFLRTINYSLLVRSVNFSYLRTAAMIFQIKC